jgi:cell division protein FtsQ
MRDLRHKKMKPVQNKNRQKRERKPRKPIQFRRVLRKASRFCLGLILISVAWVACSEGYELVSKMALFRLERIEISRMKRMTRDEIIAAAGVKTGDSMMGLDPRQIAERLSKNPWIETIKVRRRFPGALTIELTEREPVALVNMGYLFYLDNKGDIFKPLKEGDGMDFPVLTGITEDDLAKDPAGTKAMLCSALGLLDLLKKNGTFRLEDVSEIHMDKGYGFTLFTAAGGVPVKLGNSDFSAKLSRLARIYKDLSAQMAQLEYVDLDYADKIVVKKV